MAQGYNDASDRMTDMWNNDWKGFFEDVCKRTGLTLDQAMAFHSLTTLAGTHSYTVALANSVIGATVTPPKEPWQ